MRLARLPVLVALAVLSIAPVAFAAKLVPPPPPVKIVAVVAPGRAVASDGTVYDFTVQNQTCGPSLSSAVVFGHFFPGPPVSPISSAWQTGIGLEVSLENGDLWILNESCCTACYKTGTYMGNIFAVAGARVPDFPAETFNAPGVGDPDSSEEVEPEAVRPGSMK